MVGTPNPADSQIPAPGDLCLDHVAHFVADLDAAAAVFESVGLKATPLSVHKVNGKPTGTSNRCVMFNEGYVELLSGAQGSGVRLACFGTPDSRAEHRRLADHGFAPDPVVDLQRTLDSGELVRFSVVYVAPGRMAEGRVQFVQHLTPRGVWQERYLNAFGLKSVLVVADDPAAAAARWARFSGLIPRRTEEGIRLDAARGSVLIQQRFPWDTPAPPALAGYELSCRHPEAFAARCSAAGIRVEKLGSRYAAALPAALGGAWLFG